jgi:hypothetical protein
MFGEQRGCRIPREAPEYSASWKISRPIIRRFIIFANSFQGLDEYLQQIFDRIWADDKYRTEDARLFKSCMVARRPLPMAAFRVMIHDHPDTLAITTAIDFSRTWDLQGEIEETRALVNGRCQDLLAVICPQDINDRNSNDPELPVSYRILAPLRARVFERVGVGAGSP